MKKKGKRYTNMKELIYAVKVIKPQHERHCRYWMGAVCSCVKKK